MAEGGMAAAMGNVDDRDNWKVHFADTMRGEQYLNNCRMAELREGSAGAGSELEAWGAIFDRTKDGRILQRNFGGHRYPRLAHVGDRTGLEMIRTLRDHGIHQGIDVYAEHTVLTLLMDGNRCAGAFDFDRERGRFKVFPRRRWCWRPVAWAELSKSPATVGSTRRTGRHWLTTRELRCSTWVCTVPSDWNGLAAQRERNPGNGGRPWRRRRAAQQKRQALHVRRYSGELSQLHRG
jgi:hypothetical protein